MFQIHGALKEDLCILVPLLLAEKKILGQNVVTHPVMLLVFLLILLNVTVNLNSIKP